MNILALRRGGKILYEDHELIRLKCCRGHIFNLLPTELERGIWCKNCDISPGERCIEKCLGNKYIVHRERQFPDLIYKRFLRLDFYIPSLRLVIEFDGRSHYYEGTKRSRFIDILSRDRCKDLWCEKTHRSMLRIPFWRMNEIESLIGGVVAACERGEYIVRDESRQWRIDCLSKLLDKQSPIIPSLPIS